MTLYELIIDGSNLLLDGMTAKNKETFVANLVEFREKLIYFSKRGRRALLCVDKFTIDKIKKGKIKINESIENFENIIEENSAAVIYSDYEMAEYALKFGCPIVTNDKFKTWRNGTEKNKKNKITVEEWEVIYQQRVLHKMDGNRKFTTIPPLQHRQINFIAENRSDIQAQEILKLKEENEILKRKNDLIMATNASLRKGIAANSGGK
tara:strand:+ start:431 stop:1054 length:624 start_codon:yes stop_codon:yes gene_type:complete